MGRAQPGSVCLCPHSIRYTLRVKNPSSKFEVRLAWGFELQLGFDSHRHRLNGGTHLQRRFRYNFSSNDS